jgi:ATP-dependent Clp protease ATP-binding subunit ClpC
MLSEKILFGEVRPGQIVLVDTEGEGEEAVFTFVGEDKASLPDEPLVEAAAAAPAAPTTPPEGAAPTGDTESA